MDRGRIIAVACFFLASLTAGAAQASTVVIDFNDRAGEPPSYPSYLPVPPQYLVDDEYAAQGVLFSSAIGGPIALLQNAGPIFGSTSAAGLIPGGQAGGDAIASFFLGNTPATVDSASVIIVVNGLEYHIFGLDLQGNIVASAEGTGTGSVLTVQAPGEIHSVYIGVDLWDNFTFANLTPEPTTLLLLFGGAAMMKRPRR